MGYIEGYADGLAKEMNLEDTFYDGEIAGYDIGYAAGQNNEEFVLPEAGGSDYSKGYYKGYIEGYADGLAKEDEELVPELYIYETKINYTREGDEVHRLISISAASLGIPDMTPIQLKILKDGEELDASEYTLTGGLFIASNGVLTNNQIELIVDMNAEDYTIELSNTDYGVSDSVDIENKVIVIENDTIYLEEGQSAELHYFAIPITITEENLKFESSDESVATVEPGGNITAVSKGDAIITISTLDDTIQGECLVSVIGYEISIEQFTTTPEVLNAGEECQLNLSVSTANINDEQQLDITITKNEVDVTENFTIQGNIVHDNEANITIVPNTELVTSGKYTINITYNGKEILEENLEKQTIAFKIQSEKPVTGITIETTQIKTEKGNTIAVNPTITPENATNQKLVWTSSNEEVAIINENGEIVTVGNGEAVITVAADDNPDIKVTINVIVQDKIYSEEFLIDKEAKTISHISENTTLTSFLNNVDIGVDEYEVRNNKQELLNVDDFIGTGSTLKIGDEVYTIIVTGDADGDGKIGLLDVSKVKLHFIELELVDDLAKKALDIDTDGKIGLLDVSKVKLHFIGLEDINSLSPVNSTDIPSPGGE